MSASGLPGRDRGLRRPAKLSWEPRRYGPGLYCAPACGRGCTWDEYQEATRQAEALCRRLGPGWKSVVHENLGWHWKAVFEDGRVQLHYDRQGRSYTAFLTWEEGRSGGRWADHASSPERAISLVLHRAKIELLAVQTACRAAENALHAMPSVRRRRGPRLGPARRTT